MFIERVPNRNSPPAVLLRRSFRRGRKTDKETLANLTHWPPNVVAGLERLLEGKTLVAFDDVFTVERTVPHGHVGAVLEMIRRLGVEGLIASRRCRERDLVVAMIAERLLDPCSKLATVQMWTTTTLAEELGVADADVDELYAALDWLGERQERIEGKLAKRHLREGEPVLYDVTSSYYEGRKCPLARPGYNRDEKKGRPIIVYGVLTDGEGRPVAVEVYPGNTGDPTTVSDQVETVRGRFGLERIVLVGDRGMLTETQIERLREHPQLGWISALRTTAIRKLVQAGDLQLSLFDKQNLAEIRSEEFPGERLVVCFNPLLADDRRRTREELLVATEKELEKIHRAVLRRTQTPLTKDEIALRAGRVIHRFKMAKHYNLTIEDARFEWKRNATSIAQEAALDGIYVVRTSEPAERISSADAVRTYKRLAHVERLFRTLKGIDLRIRPIFHRLDPRVRAHIFLCLLAYYVEWHMRKAWAPLLFDDEELDARRTRRDPIAPAQPSPSAQRKKRERTTEDGLPVQNFRNLLAHLATYSRNLCRTKTGKHSATTVQYPAPSPLQARAFQLLEVCPVR
jgi:transposase